MNTYQWEWRGTPRPEHELPGERLIVFRGDKTICEVSHVTTWPRYDIQAIEARANIIVDALNIPEDVVFEVGWEMVDPNFSTSCDDCLAVMNVEYIADGFWRKCLCPAECGTDDFQNYPKYCRSCGEEREKQYKAYVESLGE